MGKSERNKREQKAKRQQRKQERKEKKKEKKAEKKRRKQNRKQNANKSKLIKFSVGKDCKGITHACALRAKPIVSGINSHIISPLAFEARQPHGKTFHSAFSSRHMPLHSVIHY